MARKVEDASKYKTINGVKMKLCSTCKTFQPVIDFSSRNASSDGLAYSCKTCERKTAQKSYARKKAKGREKQRYEDNKEAYKERAKAKYEADPKAHLAYQAEWRQTKKGKAATRAATARRAHRIKTQTPGGRDYNRLEVIERDSIEGVCYCQICGLPIEEIEKDLQVDHIKTIVSGGTDTFDNVRCTHKRCNLKRPKDASDL